MISAFGIDHGEVSKGLRIIRTPKGLRGPGGRRVTNAQWRTRGQNPNAPQGSRIARGFNKVTEAQISLKGIGTGASRGIKGTGRFMEKHPGITGTALVGGGSAAGVGYLRQKEPRKPKER